MKSQDSTPFYEHHAQLIEGSSLPNADRAQLIPFLLELKANSRILDLGCGQGFDLELMRKSGHEAVGIEVSPVLAASARARNPGTEIWEKNFLFLSLKEASFDGVWANWSLHHFAPEPVQRVIGTAFKGLNKNGILGIVVYEGNDSFQDRGQDLSGPSRWIHPFTENAICSMIEQTGFKISKVGRQVQTSGHPLPSLFILGKKI